MASLQGELELLWSTISDLRTINNVNMAVITWLAYDILVNLEDEIQYVWKSKWSIPKALYLWSRYFPLLETCCVGATNLSTNLSVTACNAWTRAFIVLPIVMTGVLDAIFILRLNALYHRNPKVLTFLVTIVTAELGFEAYALIKTAIDFEAIPAPLEGWPGCVSLTTGVRTTLFGWIPSMTVSFVFFVMTMIKLFGTVKAQLQNRGIWTNIPKIYEYLGPLLTLFMTDGSLYFAVNLAIVIVCLLMTIFNSDNPLGETTITVLLPVYGFAGSRLILNLRKVSARTRKGVSHETPLSTLRAAPNRPPPQIDTSSDIELSSTSSGSESRSSREENMWAARPEP